MISNRNIRSILGTILCGVACASSVPAAAQEGSTGEGLFYERVAVDVVNVEVYVTDKQGNPVGGLTADDFEILEDGRPVEIVNFYSVFEGEPDVAPATTETAPAAPPADAEPREPPARRTEFTIPESQRLQLVIFVDNYNIHPLNRNRAFSRLRAFLNEKVRRGDRVMVASYDRSLHIRQPFTESASTVASALIELEELSGMATERESERSDALKEIYETDSVHTAQFRAKQFAEHQEHEVQNALDALRELLDSLAGLPGRKMLIHLSDGIPMVPGQDLYQAIQQRFADISALGEAFSRDLSRRYLELISHANSNRISFYTIDAGGLRTRSGMSAENATVNSHVPIALSVDGIRSNNLQSTLIMMADRTGGQSILNTNDISEGLGRIASDFENYYSLGYRTPATNRGRYHTIEVRLKEERPDLKLRHREGYRDKSLTAQIEDSVRASLIHGHESNPLGVVVDIGQVSPAGDGLTLVPIRVRVPIREIVLLPRGEFHEGRLRLYFSASDEAGSDAPLQELPFELRIPESSLEQALQDEVARIIEAKMRTGPHRLVIVVRDELGEEHSVLGRFVTVGAS